MIKTLFYAFPGDATRSLDIVRIAVALILMAHGVHALFDPEGVTGFGKFLSSIGFPFGVGIVWSIIVTQITCSGALLLRRLVVPACIGHMVILGAGVWLEHAPHGWFVVGPGENGMEYSVLLIACLFAVLWAYWPGRMSVANH
jgi:putative oxidoreductase